MKLGTSLGQCVKSILNGEVAYDDVILIITSTRCETLDKLVDVLMDYRLGYMPTHDLSSFETTDIEELANRLWYDGKIFQPRLFGNVSVMGRYARSGMIWIDLLPPDAFENPQIRDLWEKIIFIHKLNA